ncbi:YbbR domain-containing protein [Aequitasia blattaphilus]|uniref:CdaR family protein n=1 Tax=Aequitasia blattaphilus TaxID=2949332 RepID=A0ABT1E6B1_9FIRM|nr:CdaR family protein [Aequitasia blattaphilus]MCP1101378.1 CdaR family protein [Aequitasia blattaphilus]MCR8614018.1 CdaR family protein [Aequitasia blattaphilus]
MREKILNNLPLKILAFVIAFLLWFLVVNVSDPIDSKSLSGIQVEVVNQDIITKNGQILDFPEDTTVNVTIRAKRSVLGNIKAEDIVATADVKEIMNGQLIPVSVKVSGFEGSIDGATANPSNIQVSIDDEKKATFPIGTSSIGTVQDGNVLGEMTAEPETVLIGGPKKVIDNISRVTAQVDVAGLSEDKTLEGELYIYDNNNNIINSTQLTNNLSADKGVRVQVKLLKIKSVDISIDDSEISAAEGYFYSGLTYEPKKIDIAGKKEDLDKITKISIPSSMVVAENLSEKAEVTVDLSKVLPQDITLADPNAGNVLVTINVTQPGTKKFDVSTGSIIINNLDSKLQVDYDSSINVEITLEGESGKLDNITNLANKVSIDLKGYDKAGTYNIPLAIELEDGVKVVGNPQVQVKIEKK